MDSEVERNLSEGRRIAGETNWKAILRLDSQPEDVAIKRAEIISGRILVRIARQANLPRIADHLQAVFLRRESGAFRLWQSNPPKPIRGEVEIRKYLIQKAF